MTESIVMTTNAIELMRSEARLAGDNETGGILVGRRLDDDIILVVAATESGPKADRKVHTFSPDVDYVNQELVTLRSKYPGTDFVGTWHKHPPHLDHPSGPDWKQACEMLRDPDYAIEELVAPIVVVREGIPSIKVYYTSLNELHRDDFIHIPHKVISLDEAERLVKESRQRESQRHRDRLNDEYDRLRKHYQLAGQPKRLSDGSVTFVVQFSGAVMTSMYLICPASYPQSPPRVMVEEGGEQKEFASNLITNWDQATYLVDVVGEWEKSQNDHQDVPPVGPSNGTTPLPRDSHPQASSVEGPPTALIAAGGGVLILIVISFLLLLLVPRVFKAETPPDKETVTVVAASDTNGQPLTPAAAPSVTEEARTGASGKSDFEVTPMVTIPVDGSDAVVHFEVRGGEEPYTYKAYGQSLPGETYTVPWECGADPVSLEYSIESSDGQKVGPQTYEFPLPTCTPTPTPSPSPTPTPTPTAYVEPPAEKDFRVTTPAQAYKGKEALGTDLDLGREECFDGVEYAFTYSGSGTGTIHIHKAGLSVYLDGEKLDDLYQNGDDLYQNGNVANKWDVDTSVYFTDKEGKVRGNPVCGADLFGPGSAISGSQNTSTIIFRPAIQFSWEGVEDCGNNECPWYEFPDNDVKVSYKDETVRYQP
jgi:proteasome lid subunit RPN8/RPN11